MKKFLLVAISTLVLSEAKAVTINKIVVDSSAAEYIHQGGVLKITPEFTNSHVRIPNQMFLVGDPERVDPKYRGSRLKTLSDFPMGLDIMDNQPDSLYIIAAPESLMGGISKKNTFGSKLEPDHKYDILLTGYMPPHKEEKGSIHIEIKDAGKIH